MANQQNISIPISSYRPDIDGLRALAVMSVVIFHAFPTKLRGGFIGVDVFFVISGYLISSILFRQFSEGSFTYIDFYWRRVKRIFPALFIMLLAVLWMGYLHLLPEELKQLGKHIAAGVGFLSNIVLLNESGYFDKSSDLKPLLHLWSLGIEEQFYIIFPVLLGIITKYRKYASQSLLAFTGISFFISLYLTFTKPSSAFYLPFSRFWEMGLGSLLAWYSIQLPTWREALSLKLNLQRKQFDTGLSVLGFSGIIFSLFYIKEGGAFPGALALIPSLGSVMLIAAGPQSLINRSVLSNRLCVWIGLISYPLYLWHWPAFSFLKIIKFDSTPKDLVVIKFGLILFSIFLAWLTYQFVEKPIRHRKMSKALVAVLCIPMLLVGLIGLYLYQSDGLLNRYPEEIRPLITEIDFKFIKYARFGVCHYDNGVSSTTKVGDPQCIETKKPLVFIWGDSLASALYPGFKSLQATRSFGIAQATECGTPPVLNINSGNVCANQDRMNQWNKDVLKLINKLKPDILILHGYWKEYGDEAWLLNKLNEVIPVIKQNSKNTKIILLGNVPEWGAWNDGLPRSLYRFWKKMVVIHCHLNL